MDERIARINQLARKAREEGLTPEEKEEQHRLRREYVEAFRRGLLAELENVYFVEPDGTKRPVLKKGAEGGGQNG